MHVKVKLTIIWIAFAILLVPSSISSMAINRINYNVKTDKGPELKFIDKRVCNYGDINQGDSLSLSIGFQNIGDEVLGILNVTTTCNCTSAKTDHKFYAPSEKGVVSVLIDTKGKYGPQTAIIRLKTNTEHEVEIIRIDYNVIKRY